MTDITETPEAPKKGTQYLVYFAASTNLDHLTYVGGAEAVNDQKAIAAVVGDAPVHQHYVAVPARNLRVRTVTIESRPKVVIG